MHIIPDDVTRCYIIDKIVDEFLDVIVRCKDCSLPFSSLGSCILNEIAFLCECCNKYVCGECKETWAPDHATIYLCCHDCRDNISDSEYGDDDGSDDYGSGSDYDGSDYSY